MVRPLVLAIFVVLFFPGLGRAAVQEADCGASQITQALIDDPDIGAYWTEPESWWEDAGYDTGLVYQGWFRGLRINPPSYGMPIIWDNFSKSNNPYVKWGACIYSGQSVCGGASEDVQICWSEEPFTLANTSNGETCVGTLPETGTEIARDQTIYAISIDRRGDETEYCQIEFKTLATGEEVPSGPPGTGTTSVVGLAATDPETDETPDGPLVPFPDYRGIPIPTPFMPHFLLIGLTCLLATLGVRRVRRRKVA